MAALRMRHEAGFEALTRRPPSAAETACDEMMPRLKTARYAPRCGVSVTALVNSGSTAASGASALGAPPSGTIR